MKIRSGFVSNSSSSSFVFKGYIIPKDREDEIEKELPKLFKDFNYQEKYDNLTVDKLYYKSKEIQLWYEFKKFLRTNEICYTSYEEDGAPEDSILIGELLQDTEDDYLDFEVLDCSEDEILVDIKEKLKLIVGDTEFPVKIIVGTRSI